MRTRQCDESFGVRLPGPGVPPQQGEQHARLSAVPRPKGCAMAWARPNPCCIMARAVSGVPHNQQVTAPRSRHALRVLPVMRQVGVRLLGGGAPSALREMRLSQGQLPPVVRGDRQRGVGLHQEGGVGEALSYAEALRTQCLGLRNSPRAK